MCSIVLRIDETGICIGANRDEMLNRPWQLPACHWPELPFVVAGRDTLAGGTWLGLNAGGVVAAVLNRHGSLGPAPGLRSRGELPLIALRSPDAATAAAAIARLDAGQYRSFNLVIADARSAFFCAGLTAGPPQVTPLNAGVWMITSGAPNDLSQPRIARYLPQFTAAPFADWPALLADQSGDWDSALNIAPRGGFGTVSAALLRLPRGGKPQWDFAPGPPDSAAFAPVSLPFGAYAA
jgi:hypothetical protein